MTWDEFENEMMAFAAKIGYTPDVIVAVMRGGMIPARILARELGVNDMYAVTVRFNPDGGNVLMSEIIEDLKGKQVLVVEDILATGKNLTAVKEYVEKKGADVKTAALYTRPISEVMPDFCLRQVEESVTFPWE